MDRVAAERAEALRETRRDLLAFVGAFGVGLLLYVLLHSVLGVRQLFVTAAILAVMGAYAYLAAKASRFRVRLDQAGDNAYYLGLLFTLTSMAFALYEFGLNTNAEQSRIDQIISNFGIALASTVAGIFLRVFLHQMRVDPADVESMTRIELSDASKRVRASLDTVYLDFGRFHAEVRQRTNDIVSRLLTDAATAMGGVTTEVTNAAKTMLDATAANQQEILRRTAEMTQLLETGAAAAVGAIDKLKDVAAPPVEVARRLQLLSDVMGTFTSKLEAANQNLDTATAKLDELARRLDGAQTQSAEQLGATVKAVNDALENVGRVLDRDRELFDSVARSVRSSTEEAVLAQTAATEVLSRLTEVTRALADGFRNASTPNNGDAIHTQQ
jgi:hypothetical protein